MLIYIFLIYNLAVKRVLVYIYKWRRFAPPDKHTEQAKNDGENWVGAQAFHRTQFFFPPSLFFFYRAFVWLLANAVRYEQPKPYRHPCGAVIWVNLKSINENS